MRTHTHTYNKCNIYVNNITYQICLISTTNICHLLIKVTFHRTIDLIFKFNQEFVPNKIIRTDKLRYSGCAMFLVFLL